MLSGANVKPGVRLDEATIYDIAPTVMALFGQPVPRSWPGRVLAAALIFAGVFLSTRAPGWHSKRIGYSAGGD